MNRSRTWLSTAILAALCMAAVPAGMVGCTSREPPPSGATLKRTDPIQEEVTCAADMQWIESPSMPDDVQVSPSICDFHQFAWQAFWHLVQPSDGQSGSPLNFETFMPSYGLLVPDGQPVSYEQTPPGPCSAAAPNPRGGRAHLLTAKPLFGINTESDKQATQDVLVDQAQGVIYYEQLINKVEYDYITSCELYKKGCLAAANNLPDPLSVELPPGSIELKTAWRILKDPDPSYYTVTGQVQDDQGQCSQVTAGLVGLHIVVRTPNHPELIWATFEHRRNGPDCDDPQPAPEGGFAFHDPTCGTDECPTNKPTEPPKPAQLCRVNPHGGGTAENRESIQSINASIHALMPADSVWQSYDLVGTIWTLDEQGKKGVVPPEPARQAGSLGASNLTMESFFQGPAASVEAGEPCPDCKNCFTCHSYSDGSPIQMSNLMKQIKQDGGCAEGKMPASCVAPAAQD